MNIGIMSMQRIKNYGSFLQAYSLKKNIEELGHNVEFVDYVTEKCINEIECIIRKKTIMDYIGYIRRRMGIYKKEEKLFIQRKSFLQRYENEFFALLGISKNKNYTPNLDMMIIGSDEVFNCLQKNSEVGYSRQLFGKDNNAKRLITYAASAGNTTLENLYNYHLADEISEMLNKFDDFSVRDENTYNIINRLTSRQALIHLDPVFLYDYPEKDNVQISMDSYIVIYAYTNRIKHDEADAIIAFAKKNKKKIVCIGEYQNFCDEYISATPFELLAYIAHADYVITDTFHGTVFSIKLNRPFASIIRSSQGGAYGNEEKLTFLLRKFGLENRQVKQISDLEAILHQDIDFEAVNEVINKEKKRSIDYIKENLRAV